MVKGNFSCQTPYLAFRYHNLISNRNNWCFCFKNIYLKGTVVHSEASSKLSSQKAPSFLESLRSFLSLSYQLSKKDLVNSPFLDTSQTPSTSSGREGRNLDAVFHRGAYPTLSVKASVLYFITVIFSLIITCAHKECPGLTPAGN